MKKYDIESVIAETGDLHKELSKFLNEYVKGSLIHGRIYERTIQRMEKSRIYTEHTIEFYKHCHSSATTVYILNETITK
jgi:hypothetical protein